MPEETYLASISFVFKVKSKNKTAEVNFYKMVREIFIMIFWQSTEISKVFKQQIMKQGRKMCVSLHQF